MTWWQTLQPQLKLDPPEKPFTYYDIQMSADGHAEPQDEVLAPDEENGPDDVLMADDDAVEAQADGEAESGLPNPNAMLDIPDTAAPTPSK